MLKNFLPELERIIKTWPEHVDWQVSQIAMYTHFSGDEVAKWFSVGLGRQIDEHERVSVADGESVLAKMQDVLAKGEQISTKVFGDEARAAADAFQKIKQKLLPSIAKKEWRSAYKNLSYFMGQHQNNLALEPVLEAYGECLRLGIKAELPKQELFVWLKNGIEICLEEKTRKGAEDALDLIDAYGDPFVENGKAPLLEPFFNKIIKIENNPALESRVSEVKEGLEILV